MNLQRLLNSACLCAMVSTAFALDDFHVQTSKIAHEETSWRHDIYTAGDSADLWKSESPWFQKPDVTLRLSATHWERSLTVFTPVGPGFVKFDSDLWTPMFSGSFETWGGLDVGMTYGHSIQTLQRRMALPGGRSSTVEFEDRLDSVGGYVAKQWACGFKVAGTWSYTWTDGDDLYLGEFDTVGGSGAIGFARSFGEKQFGRNLFVDTSANFLYESDEAKEMWHFVWMAKVGHHLCPRVSVYGIFNLFHQLDVRTPTFVSFNSRDYYPIRDETWGEAGGGFQGQLGRGFSLTGEVTTPVLDEGLEADNAFQVRAALNWRF